MAVPVTNFGLVTTSTTYGSGDTSILLTTGHGSRLPATTGGYRYPMTWWNATDYAHPADDPNVEIVIVTTRTSDTLIVTRGQESTSASTKNTAGKTYRLSLGITKDMWESMRIKNSHQGLVLRTDRDADTAQRQVEIAALDYLVMDDGTTFTNSDDSWTGKTADITASAAGGLDTGSESGGQWYDVFAIAKEDGTKNLLLHASKSWADQADYQSGEDASQAVGSTTSNQAVSQGFKLSASGKLRYAKAKLLKVGSPTGQLTCRVYSDSAGVPGSILVSSHNIDIAKIPTSATWVYFQFPYNSSTLSASPTQYHLVISMPVSASNYLEWRMDGSAGAYANGSKALYNGSSWTADTDDDMMFVVGLESGSASVTMPTDYTKKCHLGWVYNDGSSHFVPFVQRGRSRRDLSMYEAGNYIVALNGSIQLARVNAPPVESLTALMAVGGTGTQSGIAAIGDTTLYDLNSASDTTGASAILVSAGTSTKPGMFVDVPVQGGFFNVHGTSGAKLWACGFSW